MANTITIRWSESRGLTTVKVSDDFENISLVSQLDCLKDAIQDLSEMYDSKLDEMNAGGITATISITP